MAAEETTSSSGNVTNNFNAGQAGLNMDQTIAQIAKGKLTYALNAAVENFDSSSINYQNEQGNEPCYNNGDFFPADYTVIGNHFIAEKNKHIFFLVNSTTGASQIGYMENNDCTYRVLLADACLAFDINYPIHKVVHRITNCATEIYWTDGINPRRYLDIDNVPTTDICNKLKIQPNFNIPQINIVDIISGGELLAGTYQFAIQYCDELGFGYTSYYSVTNPVSIANPQVTTAEYNYPVNKSIRLTISNLELSGYYQYYNLAVIKTVNSISSVELIGTYYINSVTDDVTYTGQNQTQIRLSLNDIFERFPYYDLAGDVTSVQDILVWDQLTTNKRVDYQKIAAQITLEWETYKVPATTNYANPEIANKLRGYLRDEVYAFEIQFLLKNGQYTDGFHIPGRKSVASDLVAISKASNNDYIGTGTSAPTWKIYNTASVTGNATGDTIAGATPYKYGKFAYWQSEEEYQGDVFTNAGLTGPIRHHKFPDVLVSPIFESAALVAGKPVAQASDAVYPIGVKVDINQIKALIAASTLTAEEKANIIGFKLIRASRSTNKSISGKGILRNVGKYTREGTDYYFPNYPYNDLNQDPFLLENTNSYNIQSTQYLIAQVLTAGSISYTSCITGEPATMSVAVGNYTDLFVCSLTRPVFIGGATGSLIGQSSTTIGFKTDSITTFKYVDPFTLNEEQLTVTAAEGTVYKAVQLCCGYTVQYFLGSKNYILTYNDTINPLTLPANLNAFSTDESKFRMVFNSPETSFGQPTLGTVLKLENAIFGEAKSHFVQVKNNAKYKFLTKETQKAALSSSYNLANATGTFDPNAMFTVYQSYLTIYINGISRSNFSYSFNSVASYDYWGAVANSGNKQREIDLTQYLIPGVQSVADLHDVNNYQRESSVYIKTAGTSYLPFVSDVPSISALSITDKTRFTAGTSNKCGSPEDIQSSSSVLYYGSLKNIVPSQYGQMYSYETVDTGLQVMLTTVATSAVAFGGDTFIGKFAFKTKLPFFIDNRVGAPDDSDIFYDEIGNVAYPRYWHSSRSILSDYTAGTTLLQNIISVKATALDCPNDIIYTSAPGGSTTTTTTTTQVPGTVSPASLNYGYLGKMYQFAYGIPYFYCESSINTDLRQATNNKEGDFYPHVSSGIPDSWLQQTFVPIAFDNIYSYNVTFSKQNTETYVSHLPLNWDGSECRTAYPFRAIYSDPQVSDPTSKVNNWLIYRPISFFDFPQSYGDLTSLDGIQNKAILARFDNKSLLYNTMLTVNTSNPQAAYLGNDTLFKSAPPIDFAETDLGYVGSQHKMLLKIPEGQITIDAKRGQIFLISGNGATDLTAFGSGVQRFMTDHLAFEILRYFPEADVDNNFSSIGLHGVYDSKFDRVIITKLDYIPQPDWIKSMYYGTDPNVPLTYKKFYVLDCGAPLVVKVTDPTYFCNKSWTMSFNFNTKSWISFHTYLPNYYIGENNFFYSGLNGGCNMTIVAAVPTVAGCLLPSGSAVVNNCSTDTTTTTSTTSTTTTTTTIAPTTTTTTTAVPTTTTTTTTLFPPPPTTTTTSTTASPTTTTTTTSGGPTTTTSTTTLQPVWYRMTSCINQDTLYTTQRTIGTFTVGTIVVFGTAYFTIEQELYTLPTGAPLIDVVATQLTVCPTTSTTTTTTLPPPMQIEVGPCSGVGSTYVITLPYTTQGLTAGLGIKLEKPGTPFDGIVCWNILNAAATGTVDYYTVNVTSISVNCASCPPGPTTTSTTSTTTLATFYYELTSCIDGSITHSTGYLGGGGFTVGQIVAMTVAPTVYFTITGSSTTVPGGSLNDITATGLTICPTTSTTTTTTLPPPMNLEVRECGTTTTYYVSPVYTVQGLTAGLAIKLNNGGPLFNGVTCWEVVDPATTHSIDYSGLTSNGISQNCASCVPPTTTSTTSSTTSTTTTALATVFMNPQNSLSGSSYTPYIDGTPDGSWDSGSRTYPLGTTITLDYVSPACSVTLNGMPYTSGTPIVLTTTSAQTFTLLNADHWVNDGNPTCSGTQLRQPIRNDCGTTSSTVISECSCQCDVTCGGTYWGNPECSGNALIRRQYYYCTGQATGTIETINSCDCSCNQACNGTYFGAEYCTGSARYKNEYYTCNNALVQTVLVSSCSCACDQTCSGTAWSYSCNGGTTLTGTQYYVCNGAPTGQTSSDPCNVGTCGASLTQVWTNIGSAYCIGGSCTLRQDQQQTNPCASGYGSTRTIDTGTASSSCGTNYWEYYCVNYGVAPYERRRRQVNTCTGNTGVDELVGYDSTDCGYYTPLPGFSISVGVSNAGTACTRTIGNVAYCSGGDPYVGNVIHTTDNPSSSTLAAGFYHIDVAGSQYIQVNSSGQVVDRGDC